MGKKQRGTPKGTAPPSLVPSTAMANIPDGQYEDGQIDYTDQHGVHWVADAGKPPALSSSIFLTGARSARRSGRSPPKPPFRAPSLLLTRFVNRLDGNWLEYDELRAYEDEKQVIANAPRSRKHKKGRIGRNYTAHSPPQPDLQGYL